MIRPGATIAMVRIVSVALVLVALLAGLASAECAWVLWSMEQRPTKGGLPEDVWKPLGGYRNFADCEAIRVNITKALKRYRDAMGVRPEPGDTSHDTCLPDTIDPRGPRSR